MIAALFADTSAAIVVEDRSEVRVRAVPDGLPGIDVMTTPRARLDVRQRRLELSVGYFPAITVRDLESPSAPSTQGGTSLEALQQGAFSIAWHDRRWRLSASEDGAYGDYNFTYLLPGRAPVGATTAPQLLPSVNRTMRYASSHTSMSATHFLNRRWLLTIQPSFWASGGADEVSRELLPFQRGPRLDAIADYAPTRRDRWTTTLDAQVADFTKRSCDPFDAGPPKQPTPTMPNPPLPIRCKADAEQVGATETWSMRWDRWTDARLMAGGAVVRQVIAPVIPERTRFYPTLAASVEHRFAVMRPDLTSVSADARVEPVTDVRFGVVDPRFIATIATTTEIRRVRVHLQTQLARTIPFDQRDGATLLLEDGEATYRWTREITVGLGGRAVWQRQPPIVPDGFFSVVGYAVLELREPPVPLR